MNLNRIEMIRPDDWHLHLRDGARLSAVLPHTTRQFGRAVIMPNLSPPIKTVAMAAKYRERILAAVPKSDHFEPLMTLYLTDNTALSEIDAAAESDFIIGCKLYPAGATTNSDDGVTSLKAIMPVLRHMSACDLPLQVHGEVPEFRVDVFEREGAFIERALVPLREQLPELRIVMEHITTAEAVHFVNDQEENVAATITPQHLLLTRNDLLAGGLKPHHYCVPVLKSRNDRKALVEAATSGDPRFFLGTDSAPHAQHEKESACGCAGVYSAHAALELYAEVFAAAGAIQNLEAFASFHGADFYGLPRNTDMIALEKESWTVPDDYPFGDDRLIPLRAGQQIHWQMSHDWGD